MSKSKDINRGGMGLGLSISKLIVQKFGGIISVNSKPNLGSNFFFLIPIDVFEFDMPVNILNEMNYERSDI